MGIGGGVPLGGVPLGGVPLGGGPLGRRPLGGGPLGWSAGAAKIAVGAMATAKIVMRVEKCMV